MLLKLRIVFYVLNVYVLLVIVYIVNNQSYRDEDYYKAVQFIQNLNLDRIFDLEFDYVIKNRCTTEMKIIQIVTSDVRNGEARTAFRKAYPPEELASLGIYRVFLLGSLRPSDIITQSDVFKENNTFNDIVQGNFIDDYRNLTYKNTMGIAWSVMECKPRYIIKQDDDIAVDLYELTELIETKSDTRYDLMGIVYDGNQCTPERNKDYKWFVTREEYSQDMYPPFLVGWLWVLRVEAAMKLIHVAQNETFFWLDDVLLTGILAQKANLVHENIKKHVKSHSIFIQRCVREDSSKCNFIACATDKYYELIVEFQKKAKAYREFKNNLKRWKNVNKYIFW